VRNYHTAYGNATEPAPSETLGIMGVVKRPNALLHYCALFGNVRFPDSFGPPAGDAAEYSQAGVFAYS